MVPVILMERMFRRTVDVRATRSWVAWFHCLSRDGIIFAMVALPAKETVFCCQWDSARGCCH